MTTVIKNIEDWRSLRQQDLFTNKKIGFVPTMGNLHQGHQSLLARSIAENQLTVLSIFVNPTQFNNPNDLATYPRTFDQDLALAKNSGVDFILAPNYQELYPDNYRYQVSETQFSHELCGKNRPGHFSGVLTIVLKLLNLVKPTRAYFGEKDFQQLHLVKEMVNTFFLDVAIIPCPTIRDAEGFALSSRNSRLSAEQYTQALNFPKLLGSDNSCEHIANSLIKSGFSVDYIEEHNGRRFGAVKIGDVRLIDNVLVKM